MQYEILNSSIHYSETKRVPLSFESQHSGLIQSPKYFYELKPFIFIWHKQICKLSRKTSNRKVIDTYKSVCQIRLTNAISFPTTTITSGLHNVLVNSVNSLEKKKKSGCHSWLFWSFCIFTLFCEWWYQTNTLYMTRGKPLPRLVIYFLKITLI